MDYRRNIKNDYKGLVGTHLDSPISRRGRRHLPFLAALAVAIGVGLTVSSNMADAARSQPVEARTSVIPDPGPQAAPIPAVASQVPPQGTPTAERVALLAPANTVIEATPSAQLVPPSAGMEPEAAGVDEPAAAEPPAHRVVIGKGDTLSGIFSRMSLSQGLLQTLVGDKETGRRLSRIRPGQVIEFWTDADRGLKSLLLHMDETRSFRVSRVGGGFQSELLETKLDRRTTVTGGEIQSSLFLAGQAAGLPDKLIMQMAGILGWDIDFALDIRTGDRFTLLYEEFYDPEGAKVRDGDILAVEFINQGKAVRALRYTDPEGHSDYYTPDGHSMRKAFLRTPVNFSRISSRFSLGRFHPVLNRIRAHKGVDYAAPSGTPVKASGDGKLTFKGRKGGYGRTLIVQHGGKYTTLYAHLSSYARGMGVGKRVRQGQVIGYVGKSGLATGPHLHYEFRVDGVHRNPLKVKLPKALPIAKKYRDDFLAGTRQLLAQLNTKTAAQVALNQE